MTFAMSGVLVLCTRHESTRIISELTPAVSQHRRAGLRFHYY